jgi:hypothetical protein
MSILRDAPVDQLSERQAKAELKALAEEMAAHDKAYHGEDAPMISDAAYDALKARNLAIEARFPDLVRPTARRKKLAVHRPRSSPRSPTPRRCYRWTTRFRLRMCMSLGRESPGFCGSMRRQP